MNKSRGRPKSIITKSEPIRIRLTKEEMYWLKFIMSKTEKSRTGAVEYAIKLAFNLLK